MHLIDSKSIRNSRDRGKTIPVDHLNSMGRESGRKGPDPKKVEVHLGVEACNFPKHILTLLRIVGKMGRDPEETWEET